jgi:hypothetical protein
VNYRNCGPIAHPFLTHNIASVMKELLESENPYTSRFVRGRHCLAVHEAGPSLGRTLTSEVDVVQKGSEVSWRDFADSCERCTPSGVHRREDRQHHADPVVVISSINSGRTVLRREQMATALARRRVRGRPESGAGGGHLDCSATSSSTSAPEIRFMCDRACRHDGCRMCRLLFPGVACGARRSADRVARVIGFRGIMSSPRILPRTVAPPA